MKASKLMVGALFLSFTLSVNAFAQSCLNAADAAREAAQDRSRIDEISAENALAAYAKSSGDEWSNAERQLIHNSMMYAYSNDMPPDWNYNVVLAECQKEIGPHTPP